MPLAIPAIVGLGAGLISAGVGFTVAGSLVLGAMVVGAVAGAVVGGVLAAVQGGNILEGVLFGAIGGAVGGALGGWIGAAAFGEGVVAEAGTAAEGGGAFSMGGAETTISESALSSTLGGGTKGGGLLGGLGELSASDKLVGITALGGALQSGMAPDAETLSREDMLSEAEKNRQSAERIANSRGGAGSDAYRVAQLQAQIAREDMAQKGTQFQQSLALQQEQLRTPIEKEEERRAAMRETMIGLKVKRQTPTEEEQNSALLPA